MYIKTLKTRDEIMRSFDVFFELRPHLKNKEIFVDQIIEQQKEGYQIMAIEENKEIAACVGFRFIIMLAWGKILYIDDLITKTEFRGKGYGKKLLQHLTQIGKTHLREAIHLDTGYTRHVAHKIYLQQGFELHCHHLALKLE